MIETIAGSGEDYSSPVRLARETIERFVNGDPLPVAAGYDPALAPRSGCFVSLKKRGELRGCIGTIAPTTESLEEEIIRNAVAACSEDPRFDPVRPDELAELTVSVDVLGQSERVASKADLDPSRYGVIVTSGFRRGLLLPDLEGVDTAERQLAIACRKGGIDPEGPYAIDRFTVTRYY